MMNRERIISALESAGWMRVASVVPTETEIQEMVRDGGAVQRGDIYIYLVGQTDTDDDTYAIGDAAGLTENSDGDLLIAPYQAGSVFPMPLRHAEAALREIAESIGEVIPDSYVQTIGIRL